MIKLDYRQFQCPHPVVETRKAMLANPGAPLEVQVADQTACENINRLATSQGYNCDCQPDGDSFRLVLTPQLQPTAAAKELPAHRPAPGQETVVFCSSDQMGTGDAEFSRILLRNFLHTLAEVTTPPTTIYFVNSGVKLACQGSDVLESLNALACRGVDIASCGLCLDYYQLKDKLQVGRTTNMLEIAERKLRATRVITP